MTSPRLYVTPSILQEVSPRRWCVVPLTARRALISPPSSGGCSAKRARKAASSWRDGDGRDDSWTVIANKSTVFQLHLHTFESGHTIPTWTFLLTRRVSLHFTLLLLLFLFLFLLLLGERSKRTETQKKVPYTNARVFKLCIHIDHDTFYRW